MAKPNARTFRYSDEVKLILEEYNNDFDFLVMQSHLKLSSVQKQIELEEIRRKYNDIYIKINQLKMLRYHLDNIEKTLRFQHSIINKT